MAGHREPATTQIESIPRPRLPIVSLDRDDRGDPLVRFTQYRSTGLNAEERYGLQKYRFPITDSGPLAPTAVLRHPPSAVSLPLGLDTETIQHARGRKRVPSSLPLDPPVCYSPLSSVHPPSSRFLVSLSTSFFSRASPSDSSTVSVPPIDGFFLFFRASIPVRSVCTTGPRV